MTDLLWHSRTRQAVQQLHGNLPQALIVDGPMGVGVLETAKFLASGMGGKVFIVEPKKSQNGQMVIDKDEGNIVIEDIRLLYEQTRTKQPGAQVYVFDTGARSMTVAAQNAFLKLLEEPRTGLYFIIATHRADQLLPTIISRSQRLQLLPITDEQTKQLIASLGVGDATKEARLAFVGRGLPARIKELAYNEKSYEKRVAMMSDAKNMLGGSTYEKLATVHKYKDNRADAVTLVDDMTYQLKVIIQTKADTKLVADIANYLDVRQKILSGGNIRLQLASAVLQ